MNLISQIESILFVSTKPITVKKIAKFLGIEEGQVEEVLMKLQEKYQSEESGLTLVSDEKTWQITTHKQNAELVQKYLREENTGELTRPGLETLTIIAYRGPISKAEIEMIRGVNCSLILRNLMIRGLIEEVKNKGDISEKYKVTAEFLKSMGLERQNALPKYEELSSHEAIEELLQKEKEQEQKEFEESSKKD